MGQNLSYQVVERKIRYPRLELKTGILTAVIPEGESVLELIEKHRSWIVKKKKFIKEAKREVKKDHLVIRKDLDFQSLIEKIVRDYANILKVRPKRIYFRLMTTKWASCSSKGNLSFNWLMKYLPEKEIKYIVFHEMCHLKIKRHNGKFWLIVARQFPKFKKHEKNLFGWWFVINKEKLNRGRFSWGGRFSNSHGISKNPKNY